MMKFDLHNMWLESDINFFCKLMMIRFYSGKFQVYMEIKPYPRQNTRHKNIQVCDDLNYDGSKMLSLNTL